MSFPLIKISAAGNRFLIIDRRWTEKSPPKSLQPGVFFWAGPAAAPAARKKSAAGDSPQAPAKKKALFSLFFELSGRPLLEKRAFLKKALSAKGISESDGLMVLDSLGAASKQRPLICAFYNRDGSAAEMCGNAACCLAFYFEAIGLPGRPFRLGKELIRTAKNPEAQSAALKPGQGRRAWGAALSAAAAPQGRFPFEVQGGIRHYTLISPGVPHAVINWDFAPFAPFGSAERAARQQPLPSVKDCREQPPARPSSQARAETAALPAQQTGQPVPTSRQGRPNSQAPSMLEAARALRRKNPLNRGAGMNVTFFKVLTDGGREPKNSKAQKPAEGKSLRGRMACLRAITFERGVEGWTAACGTGALAAAGAFAASCGSPKTDKIFVQMPGGELMIQMRPSPFGKAPETDEAGKKAPAPLLFSPVKLGF